MLKGNETFVDAILFAFGLEKGSARFYDKAAEKVEDTRIKEFFKAMAGMERGHMAKLRLYYCGMENEACPATMEEFIESVPGPFTEGERLIEEALKGLDAPFLDEADAMRIAIRHEEDTHAVYVKAARRMDDSNVRVLFKTLAEEEKGHLAELERRLKAVTTE